MPSHDLDNQKNNGDAFFTRLRDLENQLRQLRTLQNQGSAAVNLRQTGAYTYPISLPANGTGLAGFHLASTSGSIIFSTFVWSIFEGTTMAEQVEANVIGGVNLKKLDYDIMAWRDYVDTLNPDFNVSERFWIHNNTEDAKDLMIVGRWRYIINDGEVVIS